jgi:hypothetical protein
MSLRLISYGWPCLLQFFLRHSNQPARYPVCYAAVEVVCDTHPGTTRRAAHEDSLIEGTKTLDAQA